MTRPNLYVFSKSKEMKASISRYIYYVGRSQGLNHAFEPQKNAKTFSFFEEITSVLDEEKSEGLLNTAVVLDISSDESGVNTENSWNPIQLGASITNMASKLVLMYPEVYWIFVGMQDNIPSPDLSSPDLCWLDEHFVNVLDKKGFEKCIELLIYHQNRYCPLFDPSGLRAWLKKNTEKHLKPANDLEKDKDLQLAAAIDEEISYAFLHAYIAYKLGYRSYAVTTLSMMEKLFKESKKTFDLVFEDIFTNFPDKALNFHLSNIELKDEKFVGFKDVKKRIFVTVGHEHIDWASSNREYMRSLKYQCKETKVVYKPSGGIYNLIEKSNLQNDYWEYQKNKRLLPKKNTPKGDGHSAPGKLLEISEVLINRAERLYHEAKNVKECIYGAVLASEAIELFNYKTPTTCLKAIALKHNFEVKTECMFYGVEYNFDVKTRLRELKDEIKAISYWVSKNVKEKSSLNSQMIIVTEIMKIFKEHGQFDEEQECMKYFRALNRSWYFKRHPYLIFFKPFTYYFDALIGNFRYFLIAILLLPLIFGSISYALNNDMDIFNHIANAYFTFYGLQPVDFPEKTSSKVIALILIIGGFFHLGIFISYLFTILTRRN